MTRRRLFALLAVFVVVANVTLFLALPSRRDREQLQVAQINDSLTSGFPEVQARLSKEIGQLKQETPRETLDRLSLVDMYYWPGPTGEDGAFSYQFPLAPAFGHRDTERVLSNRRISKALQDVSAIPAKEAAAMIALQIETALNQYEALLRKYVEANGPFYAIGATIQGGPSFEIGNTDAPTLVGCRMQLLGLLFIAGNLKLSDAAPAVHRVAKTAVDQYTKWTASEDYDLVFRFDLLRVAGLYSRDVLAVGMIGTTKNLDQPIVAKHLQRMKTIELARFDALSTPYDQHVQFGGVPVDYRDSLKVRYLNDVSDDDLREIIGIVMPN